MVDATVSLCRTRAQVGKTMWNGGRLRLCKVVSFGICARDKQLIDVVGKRAIEAQGCDAPS